MTTNHLPASVDAAIDSRLDAYQNALFDLLRQPTVSSTEGDMDEWADLVGQFLAEFGFEHWKLIETNHDPLVYAEILTDPEAPTVVFYGHYDVQPAGDEADWDSPPFEPTIRNGSIYARGAGDNKGQFSAHVFAVNALLAADAFPTVNVKLLLEGGEESGSPGLREYLDTEATEIADADLVYIADGPLHRSRQPTLIYGHRGILMLQLTHQTANSDLHSGNFGGPVPNAANELVEVIDSMQIDAGAEIAVDGFYDGILVTDTDRELVAAIPADDEEFKEELGLTHFASDRPYNERLLLEPTLNINSLTGGYQGSGGKTIIAHEATAMIDCRLVPDQDPDAVFEAIRVHVEAVNPDVNVNKLAAYPPTKTPVDTPAADNVKHALTDVWSEKVVELPLLGGSLPAAYFRNVNELADVPVLVVPYANPDQNNHAPNEHLDLDCFENGIRTSAAFLGRFAESAYT
ncbi:M20/M25/M40 family metallo-hydrolase [Haladaptatus sp. DFWS20]|uniref:M20/M25/M40 family metallo-hydrolase n=1 Tax=Haladaptatus sp. DFWS20 TaxID=3403467 RepID=UPI003EBB8247